mgnify:CR=1 FL=1
MQNTERLIAVVVAAPAVLPSVIMQKRASHQPDTQATQQAKESAHITKVLGVCVSLCV